MIDGGMDCVSVGGGAVVGGEVVVDGGAVVGDEAVVGDGKVGGLGGAPAPMTVSIIFGPNIMVSMAAQTRHTPMMTEKRIVRFLVDFEAPDGVEGYFGVCTQNMSSSEG